jgi:hypothetical protein
MLTLILAAALLPGAAEPPAPQSVMPKAVYLKDRSGRPVPAAIVLQLLNEEAVGRAGGSTERAAAERARELSAETIDLDLDGRRDWVIREGCAAVGNCDTSVYRATRDGFKLLLEADGVQTVRARRRSSNGLRDLELGRHGSAYDGETFVYRFDGREYRRVACMFYSYRYLDARGRMHVRKRPEMTREKCEEEEEP